MRKAPATSNGASVPNFSHVVLSVRMRRQTGTRKSHPSPITVQGLKGQARKDCCDVVVIVREQSGAPRSVAECFSIPVRSSTHLAQRARNRFGLAQNGSDHTSNNRRARAVDRASITAGVHSPAFPASWEIAYSEPRRIGRLSGNGCTLAR